MSKGVLLLQQFLFEVLKVKEKGSFVMNNVATDSLTTFEHYQ